VVGQYDQRIAAEADVGLLTDRHKARVAREQVPHRGQDEQRDELDDRAHHASIAQPRHRAQRAHDEHGDAHAGAARRGGPRDANGRLDAQSRRRDFVKSPAGRSSRTARKTRCPVSTPQPGDSFAPTVCATPRITPPTSVPQSEPSPPMMTASNAKSSRSGPLANVNVVRTPSTIPATATIASESAIASPYRCALSIPISSAVSPSSDAARNARPRDERPITSWSMPRSATASTNVSKENQPTASPPPRAALAVSIPPGFRRCESAENVWSNPFWITTEKPNVTSTAGRTPRPSSRLSTSRRSPQPTTATTGTPSPTA